jgi:hypothetical protein
MSVLNHEFKASSSIKSAHYDSKNKILYIQFNSGHTHSYSDCPIDVYEGLTEAESAGSYFHAHIKNNFESQKV